MKLPKITLLSWNYERAIFMANLPDLNAKTESYNPEPSNYNESSYDDFLDNNMLPF